MRLTRISVFTTTALLAVFLAAPRAGAFEPPPPYATVTVGHLITCDGSPCHKNATGQFSITAPGTFSIVWKADTTASPPAGYSPELDQADSLVQAIDYLGSEQPYNFTNQGGQNEGNTITYKITAWYSIPCGITDNSFGMWPEFPNGGWTAPGNGPPELYDPSFGTPIYVPVNTGSCGSVKITPGHRKPVPVVTIRR